MADNNLKGFRQTYQETGKLSSGGGPAAKIDQGPSGSKRANNADINAGKLRNAGKVGPNKNLNSYTK